MKKIINLNSEWNFIRDSKSELEITDIKEILNSGKSLESMIIPINWELAGLHNFNGSVWYIKQFDFIEKNEGLSRLIFLGVDYYSDVWLNWNYLGKHEGYFAPFAFEISKLLEKENILFVKVTSPFEEPDKVWPDRKRTIKGIFSHHDCRPGGNSKQFGQDQNSGGIWNDVFIEYGYSIVLKNIKVTSTLNPEWNQALVSIDVEFFSCEIYAEEIPVTFNITTPDNRKIEKKELIHIQYGDNSFNSIIEIDSPLLWWSWDLGKANLYKLKITSNQFSSKEITLGIREVHLDEKQQFFINGKKLFLRGTNIIPTQFLSDLKKDKIEKIASLIKEANINIVRVHAHVNRHELYIEFDRQGILVWQDFSLQWTYDESLSFKTEAVKQIKEMVSNFYNHPSIAVWCCHNEPGDQIKTLDPLLEAAVKSVDSTRIIRRASNYEEHTYEGWYWGKKEFYAAAPMGPLVTEFGAQGLPNLDSMKKIVGEENLFPPKWSVWEYHNFQVDQTFNIAKVKMGDSIEEFIKNSQNYQAEVLRTAIDFYRRKRFEGINGILQFMLIDCWVSITWSIVDYFGEKKKAYDTLKLCYQPVYISVNLRQDQYFAEKKFLIDLYIINDLYKRFENCLLEFSIDGSEAGKIENLDLTENQMLVIKAESIDIQVPIIISTGSHKMEIVLIEKITSKKISYNYFNFLIVETF